IGEAVAVGVGEFPDAGRGRYVKRAGVPERAFGEHHLVGESGGFVEEAVVVGVFEAQDAVRSFFELFLDFVAGTGGVGNVKAALLVEVGGDGSIDQRRGGDFFDRKTGGKVEGAVVDGDVGGEGRQRGNEQ